MSKTTPNPSRPSKSGNCPECGGTGKIGMYHERCNSCDGTGNFINPTPAPEEELDLDNILMLYANFCHGRGLQLSNEEAKSQILAYVDKRERRIRIDELEKTKDYIEDTLMIITNDLPSLLQHEEVYQIRRHHKDSVQKNIDERISALTNSKVTGGRNE